MIIARVPAMANVCCTTPTILNVVHLNVTPETLESYLYPLLQLSVLDNYQPGSLVLTLSEFRLGNVVSSSIARLLRTLCQCHRAINLTSIPMQKIDQGNRY